MKKSASKACVPCRDRKRKCDKTLPSCSLCYRLGRICQYKILISPPASRGSRTSSEELSVTPNSTRKTSSFAARESSIDHVITDHLLNAIGDLSDLRETASKYFHSTHLWLPIISENLYYEHLPATFLSPLASHSLLSLSMALITTLPSDEEAFASLYPVIKTSIALTEAAGLNSMETVQARLLVNLFEVGHGLDVAYMSIATTARAAAALGINRTVDDLSPESEEGLRVWWGIVMLDRYYTLERGGGPTATEGLGSPRHLPRDGNVWDAAVLASKQPLPMSTPSSVRVGPFARQAQVSHLVGLLLVHLRENENQAFNVEESDQLARTLLAFSKLLPEETPQPWPRYCGALGMCYGSLMVLHKSRGTSGLNLSSDFFLQSLEGVSSVSKRFNAKISYVDLGSVSPFPPHSIYIAALACDRLYTSTRNERYLKDAGELYVMLGHFAKRWRNAGKYLIRLGNERLHIPPLPRPPIEHLGSDPLADSAEDSAEFAPRPKFPL